MIIKIAHKVIMRSSSIHGLGVFAKEVICEGEIIEECPVLSLSSEHRMAFPDYSFKHNHDTYPDGVFTETIPLGYGCIYNHSDQNNATWFFDVKKNTCKFIALRDIEVGEEICTNYGEGYWKNHPNIKRK